MGHNRKNNNRGAAINRNATRVGELTKAVETLEKESKLTRRAIQREKERHIRHTGLILDRLERLELSTYAKARNWLKARYRRWRPAYAAAELEATTGTDEPPPELEADAGQAAELEIVEPPTVGTPVPEVLEEHRQALEALEPKPGLDPKPAAVKAIAAVVTGLAAELEAKADAGGTLTELEPITAADRAKALTQAADTAEES